jgi:hypothetical protein
MQNASAIRQGFVRVNNARVDVSAGFNPAKVTPSPARWNSADYLMQTLRTCMKSVKPLSDLTMPS